MTWWHDTFRTMDELRRGVDALFEDSAAGSWRFPFSRVSFLPGLRARAYPLLNVAEDRDNIYVEALAPGIDPDSLDLTLTRGQLSIAGEKPAVNGQVKPEAFHRNERAAGKFVRTVALPVDVDETKLSASYKNGLLTITLPKAQSAKPRQIAVKVV